MEERSNPLFRAVLRPIETYFEEHFRVCANGTTVINNILRQRAIRLGVPAESILLLRNGSDVRAPLIDMWAARQQLGLPQKVPLIGYVGRIFGRDVELLVAAFNHLQLTWPAARLILAGYFNHDIEKLLTTPEAVIRTGQIPSGKVYQYLEACNLCWLPLCDTGANRGRWPLKLNDYMAVGRPVVVSDVGELGQVVNTYHLGVVARDEPTDFAEKTSGLLSDQSRCVALGQAARQTAETVFNWETLGNDLEMLYHSSFR